MSLHVTITPETQAILETQKRNATITSFTIAVLICSLIVAILFYIAISPLLRNQEPMITFTPKPEIKETTQRPEFKSEVQKKPTSAASNASNVLIPNISSPVSITVTETNLPSLDFGNSSDIGDGIGGDVGDIGDPTSSNNITFIPPGISKRCSAKDRIDRLVKEGGKEEYEDKVVSALKWLQTTQQPDGSWNAQGKPVAMTGLALLCFLGHCETPESEEFGETVEKAILYLIANGKTNGGALASSTTDRVWCYEHPIATYALAEAHTLCQGFKISVPGLEDALMAAGKMIIGNQNANGGWAYSYATSGGHVDSSVVCWQLQALKACKTTGLDFGDIEKSAKRGIEYLETCEHGKGMIGYAPGSKTTSMTPGGALCFQQWGKGKRSISRNGVKWVNENNNFEYKGEGSNLYMHYYASQSMINAGGAAWTKYNKETMGKLADSQLPDGSWPLPGHTAHSMGSTHYATCLATLMMEVYYRFLPSSE